MQTIKVENRKIESIAPTHSNWLKREDSSKLEKNKNLRPVGQTFNSIGGYYHICTADVYFLFNDENGENVQIAAHKCILASDSTKFRQMFYFADKKYERYSMGSISVATFDLFLQTFYNEKVFIEASDIELLTRLAYEFDATKCKQVCIDFMMDALCYDNIFILTILDVAIRHNIEVLRMQCMEKVKRFGYHFIDSKKLLQGRLDTVKAVLSVDFDGRDEINIFGFCVDYTMMHSKDNEMMKKRLRTFFNYIRFESLTPLQIGQIHVKYPRYIDIADMMKMVSKCTTANAATEPVQPTELSNSRITMKVIDIKDPFESFRRMAGDAITADMLFRFKDVEVPVHRCILAAKCQRLAKYFYVDGVKGIKTLKEMKYASVFFEPFYGISIEINIENIMPAIVFGTTFRIPEYLFTDFEQIFIDNLCDDTVFQIYETVEPYASAGRIFIECMNHIRNDDFDFYRATHTESFYKCDLQTVKFAIKYSHINIDATMVLDMLINWAKERCKRENIDSMDSIKLREMLGDAISLIEFGEMSQQQCIECVTKYISIFNSNDLKMIAAAYQMNLQ